MSGFSKEPRAFFMHCTARRLKIWRAPVVRLASIVSTYFCFRKQSTKVEKLETGAQFRKPSACLLRASNMSKIEVITRDNYRQLLDSFDTILTDCDGVLWNEEDPIAGAPETIKLLISEGKKVYYVTNNSLKTKEQYQLKCNSMGFPAQLVNIVSSSNVTASYIKDVLGYKGKVYMIGNPGLQKELENAGLIPIGLGPDRDEYNTLLERANIHIDPDIKCVVVGFDPFFNYNKLLKATAYICQPGCHFVSTNTDSFLPMGKNRKIPGTGSIVISVEEASQKKSIVCGKPSRTMLDVLTKQQPIQLERTIMIGDRMDTDILFGNTSGMRTLMVGTGASSMEQAKIFEKGNAEEQKQVPTYYIPSIGELRNFMQS